MPSFYDEMSVNERPHLIYDGCVGETVIFCYYGVYFWAEDIRHCIDKFLGNRLPLYFSESQIGCLLLFLIIDKDMRKKIKQSLYDDFIRVTPCKAKYAAILNAIMLDTGIILNPINPDETITASQIGQPANYAGEYKKLIHLLKLHGLLIISSA